MIDGIRRRFAGPSERRLWDVDQKLNAEAEEVSELPAGDVVVFATARPSSGSCPAKEDSTDYYRAVVQAALENGGRYHGQQIPVPWLRMILAGLESRPIGPEVMWYEVEADTPENVLFRVPSHVSLFPSDRTAAAERSQETALP